MDQTQFESVKKVGPVDVLGHLVKDCLHIFQLGSFTAVRQVLLETLDVHGSIDVDVDAVKDLVNQVQVLSADFFF